MTDPRPLSPKVILDWSSKVYDSDRIYRELKRSKPYYSQQQVLVQAGERMAGNLRELDTPSLNNLHFLTARSGIFQINQLTGFGFVAEGQGGRQGELVLATRGTNFASNRFDVATDANIGYGIGPGGHVVHRGFLKTFKGYQQQLLQMINGVRSKGIITVHCLGHSLGGALANLNAALLHHAGLNVHLYTIGAPRVGLMGFSYDLTKHIAPDHIYRVVNPNDPFPMLPVFPFFHASRRESEYQLNKGGDRIAVEQHLLSDGYAGLKHCNSWSVLKHQPAHNLLQSQELHAQLSRIGGGAMFSSKALGLITHAFLNLAKVIGYSALVVGQLAVSNACTAFDLLAELLTKAMALSRQVKQQAIGIVNAMLSFMGRSVNQVQEVSTHVMRWVLNTFVSELSNLAVLAMQRAMQSSRQLR